jgi:1-acyl-sn-glycerol-3-phosphate acyltransferase
MFSKISAWIFKIWGWKVVGNLPTHLPKFIIAVAPHTSNWDFPVGVLTNSLTGWNVNWVGKSTLFWGPFGSIMRWLGGVPVVRDRRTNFVDAVVEKMKTSDRFWLTIAPEGTRKKVEKFKTGFYWIAKKAEIPIVLCTFDWEKREARFDADLFWPSDNPEKDIDFIWNYYKNVKGHTPENGIF